MPTIPDNQTSGVYRTPDPPIPGPKAQKARRQRRRLRQRQFARERCELDGKSQPIRPSDNTRGWSWLRLARFKRKRMDGFRAVQDHRRFSQILMGQSIFGRSKKQRARVSQRGRTNK